MTYLAISAVIVAWGWLGFVSLYQLMGPGLRRDWNPVWKLSLLLWVWLTLAGMIFASANPNINVGCWFGEACL